jgi:hypothetical protein
MLLSQVVPPLLIPILRYMPEMGLIGDLLILHHPTKLLIDLLLLLLDEILLHLLDNGLFRLIQMPQHRREYDGRELILHHIREVL